VSKKKRDDMGRAGGHELVGVASRPERLANRGSCLVVGNINLRNVVDVEWRAMDKTMEMEDEMKAVLSLFNSPFHRHGSDQQRPQASFFPLFWPTFLIHILHLESQPRPYHA
jgi:hypothetical protein